MTVQSDDLILDILPLADGGARLVRLYGESPCITLPGHLPAPQGGSLALTELGDYCFSQTPRSLPLWPQLCRYRVTADGTPTLIAAFGQSVGGTRRYDLDFDDHPQPQEELHPVCGNFLEQICLPDTLRLIGSCAFYNCRKLHTLCAGAEGVSLCSDVFLNCFALETIVLRAGPEQSTGAFALVNSIAETVRLVFRPQGETPAVVLWYPAYWEDIEETPAHILLHTFSGQGYHYRQCFLDGKFLPAEYDAIFPQGHDADDAAVMAMLCFDRLRFPWQLSATACAAYREFLARNTGRVIQRLLKAQDLEGIRALLELDVMDRESFAQAAALATRAEDAAAAALLADAEYKKYKPDKRTKKYNFDL